MPARHIYRSILYGVETLAPGISLPRHRHTAGYATVVLSGAFIEASFAGRFEVGPGDVLLHGRFDCHSNQACTRRGPQILRLPWFDSSLEGRFRIRDPDALVRLAQYDPLEATRELRRALERIPTLGVPHWPERLAAALSRNSSFSLGAWAEREGIAPETLSRGFRQTFGVSPKLFRLETRARRAWIQVVQSRTPLTAIAHEFEFSDLAHMSRSVSAFTGFAPSRWRLAQAPAVAAAQVRSSEDEPDAALLEQTTQGSS